MRLGIPVILLCAMPSIGHAAGLEYAVWVEAPPRPSLAGESGKTWFWSAFTRKSGTFSAMYDSMLDDRDSVTGDFLVARYRYTFDAPIGEGTGLIPRHDELIAEVLLDCDAHFSGTTSQRYLLEGREVARDDNDDVLMMQMTNDAGTLVGDLCEFARQRGEK